MKVPRSILSGFLAVSLAFSPALAQAQEPASPALLQLRVVEGEGALHTTGSKSNQPIVVFVSDEFGRAVPNAAVSIRLPEEGPSGVFLSGLRTEVLLTGDDGRATLHGIQWNRIPGPLSVRITASKGEARAGAVSMQTLTGPAAVAARGETLQRPVEPVASTSRGKWILLTALIGGAAAGGVAAAARGARSAPGALPTPPAASSQPGVGIGSPSISIGKP